jgi:MoaA/NifB/PqqE/SkfB family radical SAM enzyme
MWRWLKNRWPIQPSAFMAHGFDLYILWFCNRDCDHCFLIEEQLDNYERMMSLTLVSAIAKWASRRGSPFSEVTLVGGEPSLHPKITKIILLLGKRFRVRMVTNGCVKFRNMLRDDRIVTILRQGFVNVSLESVDEAENNAIRGRQAWRDAMAAIKLLRELGVPFGINTTVDSTTVGSLLRTIEFAERSGAERINVHWLTPVGRGQRRRMYQLDWISWRRVVVICQNYRPGRSTFQVDCQIGYGYGEFEGEDTEMCAVRDRTNIQFYPPETRGETRCYAASCGMLASLPEWSRYVFTIGFVRGGLYENWKQIEGGDTEREMTKVNEDNCGECPLAFLFGSSGSRVGPDVRGARMLCVYARLDPAQGVLRPPVEGRVSS